MSKQIIHVLVVAALTATLSTQAVADEWDDPTAENYPLEFVQRPLILHPDMLEVQFGASSDFLGNAEDRLDTVAAFTYAFATRMQLGVTSQLAAVPTDGFAVRDIAAHLEYSVVPALDIRFGGYVTVPRDENDELDSRYGARLGLPMKWRTSPGSAIWFTPEVSIGTEDDRRVSAPIVGQVQLGSRLAFSATTGLQLTAFELTDESAAVPVGAGLSLAASRLFDIRVHVGMTDVTQEAGRDDKWLLGFLSFRN